MESGRQRLIGQILVDLGYVRLHEVYEALRLQITGKDKRLLGEILIEQCWLTRVGLARALAIQSSEDRGRGART